MNSEPVAARLSRSWVQLYTRGLPAEARERRIGEIESDLWEHLHDPGAHDPEAAERELLGRTLRGIHADVWWRYRTLLDQRGARHRSHDMTTATTRNWWVPVTTVLAIVVTTMGLFGLAVGDTGSGGTGALLVAAGLPLLGGALTLGGLALRHRAPVRGSWMVIAGAALAALGDLFLIPVGALIVIAGLWTGNLTTTEREDRPDLVGTRASMTSGWYRWIVAAVALGALGFATLATLEHSSVVPDSCTEANPCWQDTAAWATWILSWLAAMVTGGIGVVLGLGHLLTRHHTRPA
jgi:hypothetical protein